MTSSDANGYTIVREFAAPLPLVYEMFTTPEHFAVWWGGSSVVVPIDSVELDARTGGTWKARMVGEGWSMDWIGEYTLVEPPTHIVMTVTDEPDNPARDSFDIALEEVAGGTRLTFRQFGGNLTAEQYEQTRIGSNTFLDAMEQRLARLVGEA